MLKHLSTEEMIALLTPLVRPGKRRKAFLSIQEIAVLDAKAKTAHAALLASQPPELSQIPEVKDLNDQGRRVDVLHDDLARALSLGLEAHELQLRIAEPPQPERAESCKIARARIFPDGLSIINSSWLSEAGNAERVAHLIHKEEKWIGDLLKSIAAVNNTTHYDVCLRWIDSGKELGALEQKRDAVLAKLVGQAKATKAPQEARGMFFRVVSAILYNLDVSDAPAEHIEEVRGPIVRASDRAGKRYATGKSDEPVIEEEGQADAAPGGDDASG